MNKPYVINIGRQLGSGGRLVGKHLSEQLHIAYYDKEILNLAAQESGFCAEIFQQSDERKGFFQTVLNTITPLVGNTTGDFYSNQMSDENLFRLQSEAIRKAAGEQSCIFIGRCADYVLRNHPRCLNVFISANRDDRIRRICENTGETEAAAARIIEQGDRHRAEYYNFYSSCKWGAAATYHLCINTSVISIEETVAIIRRQAEKMFF